MEKHWLKKEGNRSLAIFALGWAADYRAVEHIRPEGYDRLCLYDYRSLEPVTREEVAGYGRIVLFAWSFGVWVSEQLFREIPLSRAVALNGTPFPVDDRYGIPVRAFAVTLRSIAAAGTEEFDKRAYGEYYKNIAGIAGRDLKALSEELATLHRLSAEPYAPALAWDRAVVGTRDRIFPPANMEAYWGAKALRADMPHYPFGNTALIDAELGAGI